MRPLGILAGAEAQLRLDAGEALPLAGGPLAFTAAELIGRDRQGRVIRSSVPLAELEPAVGPEMLGRLTAPRPAIGGLAPAPPHLMGIVNVTPDSFSDGGMHPDAAAAIRHGLALVEAGAALLDIGGESTRPGAVPVAPEEELRRVLPVIEGLAGCGVPLSIDTRNAAVMRAALAAGCSIVNDVSALGHDPESLAVAAAAEVPVVLMHAQGDPATMQVAPRYDDVLFEVYQWLEERVATCVAAGIPRSRLIVDPGIGFGKTVEHNLQLLQGLAAFHGLGCPLLLGVSRKGFIARLSRGEPADRRLAGSLAAGLHGLAQGVQMLRVHDVAETAQAVAVWQALRPRPSAAGGLPHPADARPPASRA